MNTNLTDPVISRFLQFRREAAGENNGYITDMLKFSLKSGEIIAVYDHNGETDRFKAGRVIALTEEDVILYEYAPDGRYDGYLLVKTASIFRTDCGGKYLEKLALLRSRFDSAPEAADIKGDDLVYSLLCYALENRLAVTLELQDSGLKDIRGFVRKTEKDSALIDLLGENGESNGCSVVCCSDITFIACDSDDEQILKFLNENRKLV